MHEEHQILSASYIGLPEKKPGLFPGRPWVVFYRDAIRRDGKRLRSGMRSFRLRRDAVQWLFSICPDCSNDIPF